MSIHQYIPLDAYIPFHKIVACTALFFSGENAFGLEMREVVQLKITVMVWRKNMHLFYFSYSFDWSLG